MPFIESQLVAAATYRLATFQRDVFASITMDGATRSPGREDRIANETAETLRKNQVGLYLLTALMLAVMATAAWGVFMAVPSEIPASPAIEEVKA